jgi:urease accessory protein
MSIDDLSVMQLSDSFFPSAMYSMSNGLEALFYRQKIKDATQLRDLIKVYLEQQIGPADCSALGNAYEYAAKNDLDKLVELDQTIFSMKLVREIREASTRSGTQLLKCVNYFMRDDKLFNEYLIAIKNGNAFGVYPVALAIASYTFKVPKQKAGLSLLYSFSISMIGAALRLGVLQHFDGQKIIHELKPVMLDTMKTNIDRPVSGMWQFAPELDIIQVDHERMNLKMFIT